MKAQARMTRGSGILPLVMLPLCIGLIASGILPHSVDGAEPHLSIRGSILDTETLQPVQGAHVHLLDIDLVTSSDVLGQFQFSELSPGRYRLRVTHIGFRNQQERVRVSEGSICQVTIALQPEYIASEPVIVRAEQPVFNVAPDRYRIVLDGREAAHWNSVADALEQVPGVLVSEGGADGRTVASIRGSRPDQVRVLLDDLPLNEASGEAVDLSALPVYLLDSLVVETGGENSSGGMGGAIRLYTAQFNNRSSGTGGRTDLTLYTPRETSAAQHLQWKRGAWGMSLHGSWNRGDGDFKYLDEEGVEASRLNNDFQRFHASMALERTLSYPLRDTRFTLFLRDTEQGSPGPLFLAPTTDARLEEQSRRAHLRIRGWLKRWPLQLVSAFSSRDRSFVNPEYQFNPRIGEWVRHVPYHLEEVHQSISATLSVAESEGVRPLIRPLIGVRIEQFESQNRMSDGSTIDRLLGTVTRTHTWAVVQHSRYWVAGTVALDASASARFDMLRDEPGKAGEGRSWLEPTGAVRIGIRPSAVGGHITWSLYAGFSRGFSAPSFTSSFLVESIFSRGNLDLQPEKSLESTAGAGIRIHYPGWSLQVNAAGYYRDVRDIIIWRVNYRRQFYPANLGQALVKGVDLSMLLDVFPLNLSMHGALTLQHPLNLEPDSPYHGRDLPFQPRYHGSVGTIWMLIGTQLAWDARFQGRRYSTESNLDLYSHAGTGLGPFAVHDFSVSRTFRMHNFNLETMLQVANAFDKSYAIVERMPMQGRTWRVRMSLTWGTMQENPER